MQIFNRSPRRERNTNRCPLSGSSPITARTRSASRSNPQRMSVASLAIQMRAPCASSIACKLGSPITPLPPPPPAAPAQVRIKSRPHPQAPPILEQNFHPRVSGTWPALRHLHFQNLRLPYFPATASSTSKNTRCAQPRLTAERRYTSLHFVHRSRNSVFATSSMLFCFVFVASSRNFAMRRPSSTRCGSRSAHDQSTRLLI